MMKKGLTALFRGDGETCERCKWWTPFEHAITCANGTVEVYTITAGVCSGFNQDGTGKTYLTGNNDRCPLFERGNDAKAE